MTRFIESFATRQLLPPWEAKGVRTWGFVVRVGEQNVRDYLDKFFNGVLPENAPCHYAPLPGPQFALLSVCYFPNVATKVADGGPDEPSAPGPDLIRHTEVYLAFPVLRYSVDADNLMAKPKLVWVQPTVFSDNASVVFSSREIWGTDMCHATIEREHGRPPEDLHLDVGMVGIKTFNARSVDQLLAAIHIRATDRSKRDIPGLLKANPDLKGFVEILGGSGMFAANRPVGVGESPYGGGVELHNLKQFRDCYDMGSAIYQGIVASRTSHTKVDNITLFDPAKVEIAFMWSDSIKEFLSTILGAKGPTDHGPPAEHCPPNPKASREEIDWDMDRVVLKAQFGFSFTSDVTFKVISSLHLAWG